MASSNLLHYSVSFILFTIVLMILISCGFIGRELTYFWQLNTGPQRGNMSHQFTTYVDSIQSIMAWNVLNLLALPIYTWTAYNHSSLCHKIFLVLFFLIIFLPRWIACLVFVSSSNEYTDRISSYYDMVTENIDLCE